MPNRLDPSFDTTPKPAAFPAAESSHPVRPALPPESKTDGMEKVEKEENTAPVRPALPPENMPNGAAKTEKEENTVPARPALPPEKKPLPLPRETLSPTGNKKKETRSSPSRSWILAQFTASLVTQFADIVAPLLLVIGCGWALVPVLSRLVSQAMEQADPQTKELVLQVLSQLPSHIKIAGLSWSAFGIIALALFLMVASAFSVTWQAYLNKKSL